VASAQLARPGLAQHSMATLGTGAALLVPQPGLARLAAAMARKGLRERVACLAWSCAVRAGTARGLAPPRRGWPRQPECTHEHSAQSRGENNGKNKTNCFF
jgi:hypothetical protein